MSARSQSVQTFPSLLISAFRSKMNNPIEFRRGHREGGPTGFSKKIKTLFFREIEKSFQEVSPIGLEPHQFFSF